MNLFIPIILIIISIGVFFSYIDPQYKKVEVLNTQKAKILNKKTNQDKVINDKKKIDDKYNKIEKKNLKALEKLLPTHVDNVELIVDIQRIIKENNIGIQISDISLEESKILENESGNIGSSNQKNYNSIDISFSFTTRYQVFKKFIEDIHKSLRILDIVYVNVTPENRGENYVNDNFKFDIKLRTYWINK